MNILDAVPGIGKLLDKVITSPKELEELKIRMAEIDIRETEARLSVQKAMLENKSVFVAGAIPMILWMVSIVTLFNCVISPLLAPVWKMPVIELPGWYATLAGTIVIGLFGKKAFDGNEFRSKSGEVLKPARGSERYEAEEPDEDERETVVQEQKTKPPVAKKASASKNKSTAPAASAADQPSRATRKYDTPEKVNARFAELAKEYAAEERPDR